MHHWLEVAIELHNKKIATPALWLGDDVHYEKAKNVFGDRVVRMLDFVHRPWRIHNVEYCAQLHDFFKSKNYYRAKDICMKMMDRLDLYGSFSRLDRETYIHKLSISILRRIDETAPDAMIVAEIPHSHAQYLLYEIALFCKLNVVRFNSVVHVPVLYMEDMVSGKLIENNYKTSDKAKEKFNKKITANINDIFDSFQKDLAYSPSYMLKLQERDRIKNKVVRLFTTGLSEMLKDIKHNIGMRVRGEYSPINPYRFSFVYRYLSKIYRRKNLWSAYSKAYRNVQASENYVYFPLHFEPERTTTPDGGRYHDQFLAIVELRKILPDDVVIIVKEHPSQFYSAGKGYRGRSTLFYDCLTNIKGVLLASIKEESMRLIKGSKFVATITGSVAVEAAVIGKQAVVFGNAYYVGCPNIHKFSLDKLSYSDILKAPSYQKDDVLEYLIKFVEKNCVPGFLNGSNKISHSSFQSQEFDDEAYKGVYCFLEYYFKTYIA